MSRVRPFLAIGFALIFAANTVAAATETWRLKATVTDWPHSSPSFAQAGELIQVDYVMDLDAPLDGVFDVYRGSIVSVTFNGETSVANPSYGYILAWDGLLALNAGYWSGRQNDGSDFISLNAGSDSSDARAGVRSAMESMSRQIASGRGTLRVDAGAQSFYATPISLSPVPEPNSRSLLLAGALGLGASVALARRRLDAA